MENNLEMSKAGCGIGDYGMILPGNASDDDFGKVTGFAEGRLQVDTLGGKLLDVAPKNFLRLPYASMERMLGMARGSRVRIMRKAASGEGGWKNAWTPEMDAFVGRTGTVTATDREAGALVMVEGLGSYRFPCFTLKRVWAAEQQPAEQKPEQVEAEQKQPEQPALPAGQTFRAERDGAAEAALGQRIRAGDIVLVARQTESVLWLPEMERLIGTRDIVKEVEGGAAKLTQCAYWLPLESLEKSGRVLLAFEKALARNSESEPWQAVWFSHYSYESSDHPYCASGRYWKHCISYEDNKYYCGLTQTPYSA